jgi:hypothetical protein
LATRSRLRAANEREVDRNRADQERDRAAVDEVGRRPWRENARLRMLNAKTKVPIQGSGQEKTAPRH